MKSSGITQRPTEGAIGLTTQQVEAQSYCKQLIKAIMTPEFFYYLIESLPIHFRIHLKILIMTFRTLHG